MSIITFRPFLEALASFGKDKILPAALAAAPLALQTAGAANPVLGIVSSLVLQGIHSVENKHAEAAAQAATAGRAPAPAPEPSGLEKKSQLLSFLEFSAPMLEALIEAKTGRQIVDPARFAKGVDGLIEAHVDLLKSLGYLK